MTAVPVRRSISDGIPKPTAATSEPALNEFLDGVLYGVQHARLVETGDGPLHAMVDSESSVDRTGQ